MQNPTCILLTVVITELYVFPRSFSNYIREYWKENYDNLGDEQAAYTLNKQIYHKKHIVISY